MSVPNNLRDLILATVAQMQVVKQKADLANESRLQLAEAETKLKILETNLQSAAKQNTQHWADGGPFYRTIIIADKVYTIYVGDTAKPLVITSVETVQTSKTTT